MGAWSVLNDTGTGAAPNVGTPQQYAVHAPTLGGRGMYPVIMIHGTQSGPAPQAAEAWWQSPPLMDPGAPLAKSFYSARFVRALSSAGLTVFSHDLAYVRSGAMDYNPYGNTTARDIVKHLINDVGPRYGCRSGKGVICGASQGASAAVVFAQEHPEMVAMLLLVLPHIDIEAARYAADLAGTYINHAYGMADPSWGSRDDDGTATGHVGWYYDDGAGHPSLTYPVGSPLAGLPVSQLDPRNTAILDAATFPIIVIWSDGDTITGTNGTDGTKGYNTGDGLPSPGATNLGGATIQSWAPAVGAEVVKLPGHMEHQGNPQPINATLQQVENLAASAATSAAKTPVQRTNGKYESCVVLSGTWVGTVTFEALESGSWSAFAVRQDPDPRYTGPTSSTTTGNGAFRFDTTGTAKTAVRVKFTARTSGTVVVTAGPPYPDDAQFSVMPLVDLTLAARRAAAA